MALPHRLWELLSDLGEYGEDRAPRDRFRAAQDLLQFAHDLQARAEWERRCAMEDLDR